MMMTTAAEHLRRAGTNLRRAADALEASDPIAVPEHRMQLGMAVHRVGVDDAVAFAGAQESVGGRISHLVAYDPGAPLWDGHYVSDLVRLGCSGGWASIKTLNHQTIRDVVRSTPEPLRSSVIWSVWHEPEDDIEAERFSLGDWIIAQEVLADVGLETGVSTAAVLMGWTWNLLSSRTVDTYLPGVAVHPIFGVDLYDSTGERSLEDLLAPVTRTALSDLDGIPIGIREIGTKSVTPQAWWQDAVRVAHANGVRIFCPWDSTRKRNYSLWDGIRRVIADEIDAVNGGRRRYWREG